MVESCWNKVLQNFLSQPDYFPLLFGGIVEEGAIVLHLFLIMFHLCVQQPLKEVYPSF